MAQVVTNENMLEFIQNRQVPEFKAPEAKPEDASAADVASPQPSKEDSEPATDASKEPARGADGKFVKTEEPAKAEEPAAKAADDDEHDDDGAKLSDAVKRKIDKIVAKKHRAMKEAEEFARDEYRERKAAVERAEALQRQIDELKAGKSDGAKPPVGDKPKAEDFKTVGEYTDALVEWKFNQRVKAQEESDTRKQQQQAVQSVQQQFADRVAATAKEIPDYHEVIESADWEVPHHMQAYIVDSENGARLGYHFAKHRDEFDRIAKLSPIRAMAELGKLEDRLFGKKPEAPSAPAAPTQVSRAPAPITPLEGKSTTVAKDPSQMTFAELRAHRQAERAAGKYR
jgi:hypothetical protein